MVIYRKYRPQYFNDVAGQENTIQILKGALKRNSISHAYLFSGPRGTGKTTIARILAKSANCEKLGKDFEPCGKCGSCLDISEGRSLDFIEIDAASNRGIDEIRQLKEGVSFSPAKSRFRIFVLDEVHMLTKEAFNALLKTLEEPPEHTIFILATTELHKVPATIISRCQKFNFKRLPADQIAGRLKKIAKEEKISAEDQAIEIIAKNCDGCVRDAESVFSQISLIEGGKITMEGVRETLGLPDQELIRNFSEALIKKDASAAISLVDKILEDGRDLSAFVYSLASFLRSVLMLKISESLEEIVSKEHTKEDINFAKALSVSAKENHLIFAINKLSEIYDKIKYSQFPNVYLEMTAAEICLSGDLPKGDNNDKISADNNNDNVENTVASEEKNTQPDSESSDILKLVQEKWEQILSEIKEKNHSIHAFMKVCVPAQVIKNELYIAVGYQFHKDRLNSAQGKNIIESVLDKVVSRKLVFKVYTEKELKEMGIKFSSFAKASEDKQNSKTDEKVSSEKQEDLLLEALKMFGGTVIVN